MSDEKNEKEKRLKILGDFFGFLAIITVLFIPFLWGEMLTQTPNEKRLFYMIMIEALLLVLVIICLFYLLRYIGNERWAELTGIGLFGSIILVIFVVTIPFVFIAWEIISSSSILGYELLAIFVIILTLFIWFISALIYYLAISSNVISL